MRLTTEQKDKSIDRLWEVTCACYTGVELPARWFFEDCVRSGEVFVDSPLIDGYALVNTWWCADYVNPLLRSIAVRPVCRRLGIASALLNELEAYYRTKEADQLVLHVKVTNKDAQRLYLKHGWEVKTILRGWYDSEGDGLEMRKKL
jgi:ribosomal protein S18 acetylase RimI-like enzyme